MEDEAIIVDAVRGRFNRYLLVLFFFFFNCFLLLAVRDVRWDGIWNFIDENDAYVRIHA